MRSLCKSDWGIRDSNKGEIPYLTPGDHGNWRSPSFLMKNSYRHKSSQPCKLPHCADLVGKSFSRGKSLVEQARTLQIPQPSMAWSLENKIGCSFHGKDERMRIYFCLWYLGLAACSTYFQDHCNSNHPSRAYCCRYSSQGKHWQQDLVPPIAAYPCW